MGEGGTSFGKQHGVGDHKGHDQQNAPGQRVQSSSGNRADGIHGDNRGDDEVDDVKALEHLDQLGLLLSRKACLQ